MANKSKKEAGKSEETEETTEPTEPVSLKIRREHLSSPHSIELRRGGGELVLEARTEDHRHSETIGARTIEHILLENGAPTALGEEDELVITFSPHNGEIIAITPGARETAEAGTE